MALIPQPPDDDLVGRVVTMAVAIACAHVERFVSNYADHQRAAIEAAVRAEFAGQTARVRKNTALILQHRNQAIRNDHGAGVSVEELMCKFHLSRSQIIRIISD